MILAIGTQGNPNLVRCPVGEGAVVQYQLDDPGDYIDEHITVIGAGDAGIENALGLAADPEQRNVVTIVNRSADFATAKDANVKALTAAEGEGGCTSCRDHRQRDRAGLDHLRHARRRAEGLCDRVIARMGSAPPRAFVEGCCASSRRRTARRRSAGTGVQFTSADRISYPCSRRPSNRPCPAST